jgi:hypothetical protein
MSIAGHLGRNVKVPRIPRDLFKEDAEQRPLPKSAEREHETAAYGSVEDYDPVLRAHCRL